METKREREREGERERERERENHFVHTSIYLFVAVYARERE